MSPVDEKLKHKLKIYIIREHQRKRQQEMRREIEREIYYVQKMIHELWNKKHTLIQKFKHVLDKEIEIARQKNIKRMSACSEDSMMEKEYVERIITFNSAYMHE